ncbi:MAG: hypothetical protein OXC83_12195 [Chloroflexi bacterium]|nr:hypothetical protein [Chloroflexota bacterium]
MRNFLTAMWDQFGKFAHAVRERWPVLTFIILTFCLPFYVMAWCLDVFDTIASSVTVSVAVTIFPAIQFLSPPEPFTKISNIGWFSAFALVGLALFFGVDDDIRFLTFSAMFVIFALPLIWIFWQIVRHELILIPGFALALIAMLVYWAGALTKDELTSDLLLLPLPFIFVVAVGWAPIGSLALNIARKYKNVRIWGPATQALAMGLLFMPAFLASFTIPNVLELSDPWSAACVTIVGVVLGAVISEPLKNMFLEWGNLKPETGTPK